MKAIINTINAPAPIGPYSQAVVAGNFVYISGQVPINPLTNEVVSDSIKAETIQVMENIKAILLEADIDFVNIIKTSIFLTNMQDFAQVNEIYGTYFTGNYPARETIQVAALPKSVNVEISVIAVKA